MKSFLILLLAAFLALVAAGSRPGDHGNLAKCETTADCDNTGDVQFECLHGRCRAPKIKKAEARRAEKTARAEASNAE